MEKGRWIRGIMFAGLGMLLTVMPVGGSHSMAVAGNPVKEIFGPLAGNWSGRGTFKPSKKKRSEAVSCRVSYRLAGSRRVTQSVRCSGADFLLDAAGSVLYSPATKLFGGLLTEKQIGWTMRLSSGKRRGKGIRFRLVAPEAGVKGYLTVRILGRNKHIVTVDRYDHSLGRTVPALSMTLRRR